MENPSLPDYLTLQQILDLLQWRGYRIECTQVNSSVFRIVRRAGSRPNRYVAFVSCADLEEPIPFPVIETIRRQLYVAPKDGVSHERFYRSPTH